MAVARVTVDTDILIGRRVEGMIVIMPEMLGES